MNFDIALKSLTALVGLGGLWFGLWQYRAARAWKRLEFAASLLDKLSSNPDYKLATIFLDWRQRTLNIPDRFRTGPDDQKTFFHSHQLMAAAFDLQNREKISEINNLDLKLEKLTLENLIYVEVFDAFFGYLEQVSRFIELGLIKLEDVDDIKYWAKRVSDFQFDNKAVFRDYLKHYNYKGVLVLVGLSTNYA